MRGSYDAVREELNKSHTSKDAEEKNDETVSDRGVLLRGTLLMPPESLHNRLIDMAHVGHLGIIKTKERLRMSFWWPGMDIAIECQVRDCVQCIANDKPYSPKQPPLV